jgi:hypothetical protein
VQVTEGPSCVYTSLTIALELFYPFTSTKDLLWGEPFPAASLFIPSVLDSCFTLLERLSRSPGSKSSSSYWPTSTWTSSSGSSNARFTITTSDSALFGKGDQIVSCQRMVSIMVTVSPPPELVLASKWMLVLSPHCWYHQ